VRCELAEGLPVVFEESIEQEPSALVAESTEDGSVFLDGSEDM
jgi:hypothetical protein